MLGVIARKPIHLLTEEERKQVPKIKDLWLDIGAADKDEAAAVGPHRRPGDRANSASTTMRNNLAVSPAMDDKAGLWVVIEALPARADRGKLNVRPLRRLDGAGGNRPARRQTSAFGIDPQVGIAVDVTHATDCPTIEKKEEGDVALGQGPVIYRGPNMNPKVVERLIEARRRSTRSPISWPPAAGPRGTDANAIQVNRAGVATGLVSIPNRYMHSPVEMISLDDIDHAADLLARFVEAIPADAEFIP